MDLIPRKIIDNIEIQIKKGNIVVLIGARQVGKTSILRLVQERLQKQYEPKNIFYFDLERPELINIFKSEESLIRYITIQGGNLEKETLLLIDEFQYMPEPTKLLKILHDTYENIRIIVSGSSSLEIRRKVEEPLTGRKRIFTIWPLDFKEFLVFKNSTLLKAFKELPISKEDLYFFNPLSGLLEEFILFGGYPKVVLTNEQEEKEAELREIYKAYINKDIKHFLTDEDIPHFNDLVRILSTQTGNLCNTNELSNTLRISRRKIEKYLFLLEQTFVIYLVKPFFKNTRKEVTKMKKVFMLDTGIVNSISNNFSPIFLRSNLGQLVETFVFSELSKIGKYEDNIFYWRTISQTEVDFIIQKSGYLIPIEVKYNIAKTKSIPKALRSFAVQNKSPIAIIITKNNANIVEEDGIKYYFIPAFFTGRINEIIP